MSFDHLQRASMEEAVETVAVYRDEPTVNHRFCLEGM